MPLIITFKAQRVMVCAVIFLQEWQGNAYIYLFERTFEWKKRTNCSA